MHVDHRLGMDPQVTASRPFTGHRRAGSGPHGGDTIDAGSSLFREDDLASAMLPLPCGTACRRWVRWDAEDGGGAGEHTGRRRRLRPTGEDVVLVGEYRRPPLSSAPDLRMPPRLHCRDGFTVKLSDRLRRSSVALLMAVLLVAPMIDCSLLGGVQYLHPVVASADASASTSHDHHSGPGIGQITDHCDQHMTHCIVQSVLPAGPGLVLLLLWLVLAGAAALGAVYLMTTGTAGVRGPPVAGLPVLNGQDILSRFCIARR